MESPRKKTLRKFSALLLALQYFIVPSGAMQFKRYRLRHVGWIWLVFPKLALEKLGEIDLAASMDRAVKNVAVSITALADSSEKEIRKAVALNAQSRAAKRAEGFRKKGDSLIFGSKTLPSAIVAKGRTAAQAIHRSIVEAVGTTSAEHFEKAIRKTLTQMLAYAREEAGAVVEVEHALPQGTRFVYYGDPITLYIIEEPPRVRTVVWDEQLVTLSFPYIVFPIYMRKDSFESMQVFFRSEPLRTPQDALYMPPLPDVMEAVLTENGAIRPQLRFKYWACFPGPKVSKGAPADVVKSAQQVFWSSEFRSKHWGRSLREKMEKEMKGFYEGWHTLTNNDPVSILKTDWVKTPYTPDKLGKDLKLRDQKFDIRASVSKLDHYAQELSVRIGTSMQEAVLAAIGTADDVRVSRAAFDKKLEEAVAEVRIEEQLGQIILEELKKASDDSGTDTIVATIARAASAQLLGIITPAMTTVTAQVAQELRGPAKGIA